VIGIGTRWSDFTTASKSAFENPAVRFVNVNVAELDVYKQGGIAVTADARVTLEALSGISYRVEGAYRDAYTRLAKEWDAEVTRLYALGHTPLPAQSEVIGAVNEFSGPTDVVVCAAGSMPASSTSSGGRATASSTTSSTAIPAWATRSRALSA